MEFFVDMFAALDGVALVVDALSFEIIAEVPVVIEGLYPCASTCLSSCSGATMGS